MIINILLDDATAGILQYYGDVSDVVNRILYHGAIGDIPLMDLPPAPLPGHGAKQYKINVTDKNYLELCDIYGTKSSRISLRRIIYAFVDNEKYVDLAWESNKTFVKTDKEELLTLIGELEAKLFRLYKMLKNNPHVKNIKTELAEISNEVWNE